MALLSAREFEESVAAKLQIAKIIVLSGDNSPLKSDLFRAIRAKLAIDSADPFRLVQLDSNAIESDPARLADEMGAISMFGGSRLIRAMTTPRQAGHAAKQALESPAGDWILVLDTDEFEPPPNLSSQQAGQIIVVACNVESDGDFHSFARAEFERAGIRLGDGVIETFVSLMADDRTAARGEIEKLALLHDRSQTLTVDDIRDTVANGSSILADEIAATALSGNLAALVPALDRLHAAGADPANALGAASRLALNLYRGKLNQWRSRTDSVAQNLSAADLRGISLSLHAAVLQSRAAGGNSSLLAERALISLGAAVRPRKR
ncbi:MAG: DNA polymerase III subunit delta [Rhodoblastus sp.]